MYKRQVINKSKGRGFALTGLFLGGGCFLSLLLPALYSFILIGEISWASFIICFSGPLFFLVLILPTLILAIFLTRFHCFEFNAQ